MLDQWQKFSQSALITGAPVKQESGYVVVVVHRPGICLQTRL
jgi:hypothetical protein